MFHCVVNRQRWILVVAGLMAFAGGAFAQADPKAKTIRLRNDQIVTLPSQSRASVPGPATGIPNGGPRVSGLYLVQFEEPLQPAWREQLTPLGADLLRSVPDDAFIVRLRSASLEAIRALPFVRWAGEYRVEHRVLRALEARARAAAAQESLDVAVLTAPGAAPDELAEVRRDFDRVTGSSNGRYGSVLRGRMPAGRLRKLASSPAVLWVEPAPKFKLNDEVASKIVAGDGGPGQLFTQGLGFDGAGVTVAVADSGLDSGDVDFMHPDLAGRVTGLFYYGDLTDAADEHSHGTHVAGIVGGNGAVGELDEFGALYGLGVAPGVDIVAQRIFDGAGAFKEPPSFETLTRDAVRAGADIGSNSWGDDTHGRYDISAMEFDALVRDADGLAFGDQPYILEFSAGNAGPDQQSIGSPAVAKNVIATGASVNNRDNLPLEEFSIYNTGQETMADFSSRGPCEDGRIKPDVVAPGTWISSLRSVYANDDNAWWPISDAYLYQGGTSQAGPAVSGAAAVLVQYWRATYTNQTPSPALVKALLINSATDMDNAVETGPVPNNDEGWGRVNLPAIIGSPRRLDFVDQSVGLATGQTFERRIPVESPDEPLRITLTYTDVPGFPGAVPALVNDLDLEVVGPDGTIYRGNQFEDGESVPNGPLADRLNNVEGVHLSEPIPGEYLVRVRARAVVQDARQDTPETVDQDFALVASGLLARPGTGILAFDRRAYTAPATMKLTLFDQDLAGRSTATITLRSGTEPAGELITLRATGAGGVFTAQVATATSSGPAVQNGRLEVVHNDFIEAVYADAQPAATRRYFSRADLLPPVIAGVTTRFEFGQQFVAWATDEEASGILRYGTVTPPNRFVTNRFLDYGHEVSLANLTPNATYRFDIVAEDAAGNRSTNNNGGAYFTFVPEITPTVLIVDAYYNDLFDVPPLSGYTQALGQLGVSYEIWPVESAGSPSAAVLKPYRAVIWRVAEFSLGTTFSASDADAVATYLAGGGSLLMSSMELLSRLEEAGLTSFSRDILGAAGFTPDTGVPDIAGAGGDPVGSGIQTALDYTAYEDFIKEFVGVPADASDIVVANTNATAILVNGFNPVGLRAPRPGVDLPGRVVLLTFPLDAVPSAGGIGNNRAGLLRNILAFLAPAENNSSLALDRDVYASPGFATAEVDAPALAGSGSVTVRGFSPAQPGGIDFTATETARRGLFRAIIPLETPGQPTGGPALVVQSGQSFRVEFGSLSATASVENTPPVISNVSWEAGYVDAVIRWETSEPTDALVQFSDATGTFPINLTAYDPNLSLSHELFISRLEPETKYYFRVVSRDLAGNVSSSTDGGKPYEFTTLTPYYLPWSDDGESGDAEWTVVSLEDGAASWRLGVPANGAEAASPTHAWGTNLDGRPADLAESLLISPGFYISGGSKIVVRFKQNYDFIPSDNSDGFEYGTVEVYTNLNTASVPVAVTSDSSFGEWEEAEVDLTPFRGQLVHVAWHYVLFSFDSTSRLGWMIDDIDLVATNTPVGTVAVTNNIWQARFAMAGPSGRSGQGASLVLTNAKPGEYQIVYADVPYFNTPPPQTNVLAVAGLIQFEGIYTMTDANHNGISDAWELASFGSVSPSRTPATDTDGDGFTDLAEFVAGTDPNKPTSALQLRQPVPLVNGSLRFQWATVPGRAYRVQYSTDGGRHWLNVTDWILATATALNVIDTPLGGPAAVFYRIEVRP